MSINDTNLFDDALKVIADAAITGIQPQGFTDAQYFGHGAVNCSALKTILKKTPLHYKYEKTAPRKETPAMTIGSAVHCATLEPEAFDDRYVIAPKMDKRTKEGRVAWAELAASGKIVLSEDDGEQVMQIAQSVRAHPAAALLSNGRAEVAVFSEIDGVAVKCKCDYLRDGAAIIDLKTTEDAGDFNRSIAKWGYAQQAAWYMDVLAAAGHPVRAFIFVVVEKTAPYAVALYELSDEWLQIGRNQNALALTIYKDCLESGDWFGYEQKIERLEPPHWMTGEPK